MSVSHCIHLAYPIAAMPLSEWAAAINALPTGCKHADCGPPRCCQTRIREYLRGQFVAQASMRKRKRRES